MKKISVFDTTISDYNLGNQIIMESIYEILHGIFPHDFFYKLPSIEITKHTLSYIKRSNLSFFGGTNSLNNDMASYKQWNINIYNCWSIKNVVLLGTGWWKYELNNPARYTIFLLNKVLSKHYIHSVRDSYTEKKLRLMGIDNVLNTGCPTLWNLTNEHCKKIPVEKSDRVILTFTDYKQNAERDLRIYKIAKKNYSKVYAWVQGDGDYEYIQKNFPEIIIIDPTLKAYNQILAENNIDYVGTRLHAGIRALQHNRRSIIIGLDNRSLEMQKDFNLPVIPKQNIDSKLEDMINSSFKTEIRLPQKQIDTWKMQFK